MKNLLYRKRQFARIIRQIIKSKRNLFFKFETKKRISAITTDHQHRSSKHSAYPGHLDAITKAIGIGKYLIGAGRRKGKRGLLEREGRGGAGRRKRIE